MMERLAEDVITITNQNVAAASAALAERLGPDDARVEIDVDSFKYDVGIYAVGALGTDVMLFVNVLAGGLLTLAAPILAIVLKSKIAGDIRPGQGEGARRDLPRRRPRCGRTSTSASTTSPAAARVRHLAGNALYKGISEVLERTIADRKARRRGGGAAGPPPPSRSRRSRDAGRPRRAAHRAVAAAEPGVGRAVGPALMAGPADTLRTLWSRVARKAGDTVDELFLDSYREQVDRARELAIAGELAGAGDLLAALLRDKPDHAGARWSWARSSWCAAGTRPPTTPSRARCASGRATPRR
jgi:hypothetical protein